MPPSSAKNPTRVIHGERVGKQGQLRLGCSAALFGDEHRTVLLTRRADNGLWCLPGGMVDPGESVAEACEREVYEEAGLRVKVKRLTGVYSDPDQLIVYPDGNQAFVVVLTFEVELVSGTLGLSNETTEARFLPVSEAVEMNLFHGHAEHLRDALAGQDRAFIR